MSSGSSFFPASDGNLVLHLQNYRDKLPLDAKALFWPDDKVKASQERCDRIIAALAANEKKLADYKAQVGATKAVKQVDLTALRADIRLIKASAGYTVAIGRDLGIVAPAPQQGVTSLEKASATAESRGDSVRIRWKKGQLDGVNVYTRRQGESDWRRLGRDTHSPYDDTTPIAKPGVPEVREYRVIGVVKDQEVGAPSDIVSVLFTA